MGCGVVDAVVGLKATFEVALSDARETLRVISSPGLRTQPRPANALFATILREGHAVIFWIQSGIYSVVKLAVGDLGVAMQTIYLVGAADAADGTGSLAVERGAELDRIGVSVWGKVERKAVAVVRDRLLLAGDVDVPDTFIYAVIVVGYGETREKQDGSQKWSKKGSGHLSGVCCNHL